MRSVKRPLAVLLLMASMLVLPAGGSSAAEGPFTTFEHTDNLTPVGASLREGAGVNSDLAFKGTTVYQGTYTGFRVIDVSNPAAPEVVSEVVCTGNQGDVIVYGNVLVRSWNSVNTSTTATCAGAPVLPGFEGLHVFNISNPASPQLVASVRLPCGSHTATGVPDAANNRLLVYNNASGAPCSWFEIVSVPLSNPASASLVGLAPTGRTCHDTAVILGDAMLAVCAGGNGFTVMSLGGSRGGTLTSPQQLYTKTVPGVTIGHAASFSWDGEVLLFGHEPGGGTQARCTAADPDNNKSIFFYDAGTGTELGSWVLPRAQTAAENCTIHNFNVVPTTDGSRLVVSGNYQSGLSVVDFTDPAAAVEIAYADPAPLGATLITGGDWSTHWYDGRIYQSDITRGLLIWDLDDPRVEGARTLGQLNPQTQEFTYSSGGAS